MLRSIVVSPVRSTSIVSGSGQPLGLLAQATTYLKGVTPTHWIDFVGNRALIAGADVGAVADIPSISGTINRTSDGHLVSAAANGLIIPLSGVTYPLSLFVEFVRTVDSGLNSAVARVDDGDATDTAGFNVNASDQVRLSVVSPSVNQASVGTTVNVLSVISKQAGRVATNSVQLASDGALGTEDTVVDLPANPTRLVLGIDSAGVQNFTGYIRRVAIVASAMTDAQLQNAVT